VAQAGFVRTDQGATMAVGPARGGDPPAELALALSRAGKASARVRVDADAASPAFIARARELTGVDFVAGTPWRWAAAAPGAYASAIDLLAGRFARQARARASDTARLFRPALWIAGIALAFHVVATLGQWAWLHWQAYGAERELSALARAAVPGYAEGGKAEDSPQVTLARRESELEHRAGRAARDDFVPLLAQAAPALASLPAGALRSLSYADRHLTLDLTKLEPNAPERLQGALARAGLVAIVAPTQNGARLRIGRD
ncbi:MAG TPA: type II secretion system protein GspL, partial [Casimicrobiaceae bacterium]|nr:type II secretion system protein GspL [Casimicrobiaceae bacterium]